MFFIAGGVCLVIASIQPRDVDLSMLVERPHAGVPKLKRWRVVWSEMPEVSGTKG